MKIDDYKGKDDDDDNEKEEKGEKEEETNNKGLGKDTYNKAFPYTQKPKEHTKAVKKYDWG
ncbi:uncharacterized protein MONOS_15788 [Monocercomonoides exilis]|uniref:uncharacterized protein n=1 Tax=Monocercomonoides exilis TaxID=2049356 RepID=UPI003559FDDE|nr:hypothetical protein MONOS_15788 [Monocercomonoides exilis]|eukprot:MONOS_15788.1-p1 / transcript=MONOS_15788.1 / gene=MONOS_15788 / organism=Monocercomonoides_exilis_PA203 / gene_product=unspecified product / transcript_product=unspecified product / location=Mono_scaffold01356:9836-10018(+) / protein_length=61 / sequence_SO=supercontig / SO=protein_coding / is_pseudo=false